MAYSPSDKAPLPLPDSAARLQLPNDEAVVGLFSQGGPFQDFPGAVLVVGHNGIVLSANAAGEPIAELLKGGPGEDVIEAVNAALNGKSAQVAPLLIHGEAPAPSDRAYDLLALPWGAGAAALLLGRDITLERSLREALVESRQRFKDLVEAACDFAWETDQEGRFCYLSRDAVLGYPAAELMGKTAADLLSVAGPEHALPFVARQPIKNVELWVRAASAAEVCLVVTALPLYGPQGDWRGARGLCRDITDERSNDSALARADNQDRLLSYVLSIVRNEMEPANMLSAAAQALLPALPADGVVIVRTDEQGAPRRAAAVGAEFADEALFRPIEQALRDNADVVQAQTGGILLVKPLRCQERANGALCLWRSDSSHAWTAADHALLAAVAGQLGIANEQLARESELHKRSTTDALTGLLNRRGFLEGLERRLSAIGQGQHPGTLFYVDLDNFKLVNDTHGHQRGDAALVAVAEVLKQQVRSGDLAARLGGDEFALFLGDMPAASAAAKVEQILASSRHLAAYSGAADRPLGLSIGIAPHDPDCARDADALLRAADQAMYAIKRARKGRVAEAGTR